MRGVRSTVFGLGVLAVSMVALAIVGCGGQSGGEEGGAQASASSHPDSIGSLRIVCTTGMIADMVEQIVGPHGEVVCLMGPDVDPHLYGPTRSDMQQLQEADVIFYNGLLLEGKMTDALIRAATAGRKVFAVTELLDPSSLLQAHDDEGHDDPHVWMDPQSWSKAVQVVRDALNVIDEVHADTYSRNAESYTDEITALDAYAARILASVPESRRVLVTAHDAFGYFGRRYGYDVVGIQGISTESEAGVLDVERLVNLIVDRDIPAVFIESTVSDRNIKALVAGAQAKGRSVAIGGELFSDAMGADGTYEGTYIGMMDHNVTVIARALGGEAPAGGMQGRLLE